MKQRLTKGLLTQGLMLATLSVGLSACFLVPGGMPKVASVSPTDGATTVAVSSSVRASLDLAGDSGLDVQTLTPSSVTLTDASGTAVPATRTVEGSTLVLEPDTDLALDMTYTFTVTPEVKTANGTSLQAFSSTFSTGQNIAPPAGGLSATPERVVFTAGGETSSDTRTLTLTNGGSETVNVSGLSVSGPDAAQFSVDASTFSLAPGATRELSLSFKPSSLGPQTASLNVQSSDANLEVPLGGLSVKGQGGQKEPSLQWILDTYGIAVQTGDEDPSTTNLVDAPTNGLVGSEVVGQTFTKAVPEEQVTVEVLAVFGVENDPVLDFGYYTAGEQNTQIEIFSIEQTPALNAQRLGPVVTAAGQGTVDGDTVTFDPGTESFGLYSAWPANRFFDARKVFTEDQFNAFDTLRHHVRTYPLPNEPNAYVVVTDEFNTETGNDYNDVVVIVRNVVPGEAAEPPAKVPIPPVPITPSADGISGLEVANAFGLPYPDRLILQKIENFRGNFCDPVEKPGCDPTVDRWEGMEFPTTGTVNLQNTGSSALQLSLSFQNDNLFVFPNGESNLTLQPGQVYPLSIEFSPVGFDGKGVYPDGLLVQSGGQNAGLQLAGLYMLKPEGAREVYFAPMVNDLFGYKINLGEYANGGLLSPAPDSPLAGEEVRSAYWEAADPGSPVKALQIAAFYPCCFNSTFAMELVNRGSSNAFATMRPIGTDTQSIYPRQSNGGLTELVANANGAFEVRVGTYSSDPKNGSGRRNLGVRFWPLKDRSGNPVANSYIVAQDFVVEGCNGFGVPETPEGADPTGIGSNCDYQDNLYIMSNIQPVN